MIYSNLHTHSTFSDGVNTVEEIVSAALAQNFVSIGFSDHSFTEFDTRYCMRPPVMPAYFREIKRVAKKYEGLIEVYTGLELDGYSGPIEREKYDYIIGDCHYIYAGGGYHSVDHAKDEQWEAIDAYFGGDTLAYAKAYYETYVARQQITKPDILGHFDIPVLHGYMPEDDPRYIKAATDALIAALEVTPVLEVNSGAIAKKKRSVPYPDVFLLKEALAHGAKLMLSSDSHKIENLHFHFDEMAALLKSIGCREIVIFKDHGFKEVGI